MGKHDQHHPWATSTYRHATRKSFTWEENHQCPVRHALNAPRESSATPNWNKIPQVKNITFGHFSLVEGKVYPKNEVSVFIFLPSWQYKLQKEMFGRMFTLLFPTQWKWMVNKDSKKTPKPQSIWLVCNISRLERHLIVLIEEQSKIKFIIHWKSGVYMSWCTILEYTQTSMRFDEIKLLTFQSVPRAKVSNALEVIWTIFFVIFGPWHPLVSIHFHCTEKSSANLLPNLSPCDPQEKK